MFRTSKANDHETRRLTMAMQRTPEPVIQIATAIWPPGSDAADL